MNEQYVIFIRAVWQGAISATTSQINDDVRNVANTVFLEIQNCSRALLGVHIIYGFFYTATSLSEVMTAIIENTIDGTIDGWIDILLGNSQYKVCVTATALKWKSVMALALLGLGKKSDDEIIKHLKANPELGVQSDKDIQEVLQMLRKAIPAE